MSYVLCGGAEVMLLRLMMVVVVVSLPGRTTTAKTTKFNQLPDQTTVKSATSVGTPHFRSDAFQVATVETSRSWINCYRRTRRADRASAARAPSSECACNYRQTDARQIEVGSGCCCCCCFVPSPSSAGEKARNTPVPKQLNVGGQARAANRINSD